MSTTVNTTPEVDVNGNPLTKSKWNAVNHPIKFGLKREDYQITIGAIHPFGKRNIEVVGLVDPATTIFSVGKFVYIETSSQSGNFEIDSVVDPNTVIVNDPLGLIPSTDSGFLNDLERANFFIETKIYDKSSGANVLIATSINKPTDKGIIDVDVSSFLKSLVDYVDEYDYTAINIKDLTLGGVFTIEYTENWFGFQGANITVGEDFYFTNSAKQIGDLYGSNMGEYVPNVIVGTDEKAKFMTDFSEPTYFPEFPFSLTFIHSEGMSSITSKVFYDYFDINNVPVDTEQFLLNESQRGFVNRVRFRKGFNFAESLDLYIQSDGVLVTEKKRINIDNTCKDFPIYLAWLNSLGGYDYWLFFKSNRTRVSTRLENPYTKNIDDIETSLGDLDITGKSVSTQVDFGARVREGSMDGMSSLYKSPKVLYLTNPENWKTEGSKWRRVIIRNGSLLVSESRRSFMDVRMIMTLPTKNTQKE